jgi:hypothetical protein
VVDPDIIVRRWLLGSTNVTALLGTNQSGSVYCGDLPERFDPEFGPGIQINTWSGAGHEEIKEIVEPRLQIKVWTRPNAQKLARAVFRAVYDVLHGASMVDFGDDGRVLTCQAQDLGQDVSDPDTGWTTVVGFFQARMIQTSIGSLSDFVNDATTVKDYVDEQIASIAGVDDGEFS